eukprot:GHVS01069570.1.p1 GENE.GHVS01069570.1~~GHVS01069570.1.p1  ORF type:complete len:114 (-),score=0.77 GHVS01069570.1:179-520(-)
MLYVMYDILSPSHASCTHTTNSRFPLVNRLGNLRLDALHDICPRQPFAGSRYTSDQSSISSSSVLEMFMLMLSLKDDPVRVSETPCKQAPKMKLPNCCFRFTTFTTHATPSVR